MTAARRRTCWRIGMFLASMLVLVLARSGQAQSALPGAPQNLTGRALGTTVTFQWLAPTSGSPPSSYVVEAALAPAGAAVASLGVSETSLVVPGVPLGVYFVRVRGLNGAGRGAASNEVVVTVPGGGTVTLRLRLAAANEGPSSDGIGATPRPSIRALLKAE